MVNSDDETEEALIYIKFDSVFDAEALNSDTNFKLIGLDTDEPIMQLGAQVFTGRWEASVGTCTFFEDDQNFQPEDPVFSEISKTNVRYVCQSRKVLRMHRTILTKKSDKNKSETEPENGGSIEDISSSIVQEDDNNTDSTGLSKDFLEAESDLTVEDIERISLSPNEVNTSIVTEIMKT